MANVGKQIKKLRSAKGMTQDQLAEKLFVSRQTVSNYEMGKSNPDIDMLVRIAEIFETEVNRLIYGPPPQENRRGQIIYLSIFTGLTAVLGVLIAILTPWAKEMTRSYFIAVPGWLLALVAWPTLCFCGGITLGAASGLLLGGRKKSSGLLPWLHWGILVLFVIYVGYICAAIVPVLFLSESRLPIPRLLWQMNAGKYFVFLLLGWLFWFTRKKN